MKMDTALFLEFKLIEIGKHVAVGGVDRVPNKVLTPVVGIPPSHVSSGDLFQGMSDIEGIENWKICSLETMVLPQILDGGQPGKGPLARADCQKERGIVILVDGVKQVQVLPLPVGSRNRYVLKTNDGITAGGSRRADCTGDGLKQPTVILVLQKVKVRAVALNG